MKDDNNSGGGLWRLYRQLLRYLRCLPDELNKQDPSDIWRLMDSIWETAEPEEEADLSELPPDLRVMYGL